MLIVFYLWLKSIEIYAYKFWQKNIESKEVSLRVSLTRPTEPQTCGSMWLTGMLHKESDSWGNITELNDLTIDPWCPKTSPHSMETVLHFLTMYFGPRPFLSRFFLQQIVIFPVNFFLIKYKIYSEKHSDTIQGLQLHLEYNRKISIDSLWIYWRFSSILCVKKLSII